MLYSSHSFQGGITLQENKNIQIFKMECTGCSNYCLLHVELEDGELSKIEGNGCKRAYVSVNRQLNSPK